MIVEYLFIFKYIMYDKNDYEKFIEDMKKFVDATLDYSDRMFFYVKRDDVIISKFVLTMMEKYKCLIDVVVDTNEYSIMKYKLFKYFTKYYPEIIMDTDFKKLNIAIVKFRKKEN